MGLLANNFRDTLGVYKFYGAGFSNGAYPSAMERNFHRTGAQRNLTAGEGVTNQAAGYPYGYREGGSWSMAQKAGAMSSVNEVRASLTATGNAAQGINLISNATLTIVVVGSAAAVAAAAGSSTLAISVSGNAVAPLNATGSATLAISASASASGIASITGAATAAVTGAATTGGIGHMTSLPISQDLTVDAIASGVWGATAAANNTSGTMGQKLNSAASGGVDYAALAEAVWEYVDRTLTSGAAPTAVEVAAAVMAAAQATAIEANIKYVNDVAVSGDGSDNNPWNPA